MERISLYVMTKKGLEVLQRIISVNKSLISTVVIGRDLNVADDYSTEILSLCVNNEIKYFIRGSHPKAPDYEYIFAISWRWMINHPNNKLIIFHDSLLPKYRGFAPLVNMLINGEREIGVSAIWGASEYDRGDLIAQKSSVIEYPLKIAEAIEINNNNFLDLVESIARSISNSERLTSIPQVERDATYSIWRDFDDYFIDWTQSSTQIKRLIDAVGFPYSGARSRTSNGDEVIIEDAEIVEDVYCEIRHIGKVIFVSDGNPTVICGSGMLKITKALISIDGELSNYLPMKRFRVRFQ